MIVVWLLVRLLLIELLLRLLPTDFLSGLLLRFRIAVLLILLLLVLYASNSCADDAGGQRTTTTQLDRVGGVLLPAPLLMKHPGYCRGAAEQQALNAIPTMISAGSSPLCGSPMMLCC